MIKEKIKIIGRIYVVLKDIKTNEKKVIEGRNVLCEPDGENYYAQMGAGRDNPENDFTTGGCKLGTGTTPPLKTDNDIETYILNSYKSVSADYPLANDGDTDNTGRGVNVITWKYFWETTEVNVVNIKECAICITSSAPPSAILQHGHFGSAFPKTDTQTLTVFINHEIVSP